MGNGDQLTVINAINRMSTHGPNLPTLCNQNQIVRLQKLDATLEGKKGGNKFNKNVIYKTTLNKFEEHKNKIWTCNAIDLHDEGEATGGPITLAYPLKEVVDLLRRVHHGVLADVEIRGLGAVDLEHPEEPFLPIAPN